MGPRMTEVVRSEPFQVAVGLMTQARKAMQTRAERTMRRALHTVNLPAGSDVTRILNELGRLQREVRELTKKLDAATRASTNGKEVANGSAGRAAGSPRPRAARR